MYDWFLFYSTNTGQWNFEMPKENYTFSFQLLIPFKGFLSRSKEKEKMVFKTIIIII